MRDVVVSFTAGANAENADDMIKKKWAFLCLLGQIEDGDPTLECLFAMARGDNRAYDRLNSYKKDKLVFGGYVDNQGCLLEHFREIAQSCVIQETNPQRYRIDFSVYRPLIAFMQGECGQTGCKPVAP